MKHATKYLVITIALLLAVPAALAQTPEVSTLPVTEAIDVGGTILQPGTYTIKVVSPRADRNKVQITSVDGSTIYATLLTIPHDLEPNEEIPSTRFVFFPAANGQPRVLRTWFPPDPASGTGHDIVYDEARAKELARLANEDVVYYSGEDMADLSVVTPEATVEPYVAPAPEPEPVVTPAPAPVTMMETQTTMESETMPMTSAADTDTTPEMPQTAGRIPLIVLLGLMSLVAAVAVRFVRA